MLRDTSAACPHSTMSSASPGGKVILTKEQHAAARCVRFGERRALEHFGGMIVVCCVFSHVRTSIIHHSLQVAVLPQNHIHTWHLEETSVQKDESPVLPCLGGPVEKHETQVDHQVNSSHPAGLTNPWIPGPDRAAGARGNQSLRVPFLGRLTLFFTCSCLTTGGTHSPKKVKGLAG